MRVLLGVDGGGTKSRAVAYAITGDTWSADAPLGVGVAGPCNLALMSPAQAANAVEAAVGLAGVRPKDVAAICAAVAGYAFASRRQPFCDELRRVFPAAHVHLAPDYLAAFAGAFPAKRGVIVIAGTGSVAYASSEAGVSHRSGGYGYLIDDSGSGYGVGRGALTAILRSIDGSGEATILTERIAAAIGVSDWDGLIEAVYGGTLDRVGIAALSIVVSSAAESGDAVATDLLTQAGGALARLAEAAYLPVFGTACVDPVRFAVSGSLWQSGGVLLGAYTRSVLLFAPNSVVMPCETDPAVGAAHISAERFFAQT